MQETAVVIEELRGGVAGSCFTRQKVETAALATWLLTVESGLQMTPGKIQEKKMHSIMS